MRKSFIGIASLLLIPLLLGSGVAASRLLAASSDAGSLKAKGEAEKQGSL